jgi:hypothetical protein
MNRYKSRQRWKKGNGGYYSPDGKWTAQRRSDGTWRLCTVQDGNPPIIDYKTGRNFLTLADCQEIAERPAL